MRHLASYFRLLSVLFVAGLVAPPANAQEELKPPLSTEISKAIDQGGPAAGKQRFSELYPAHKDEYMLDISGFSTLMTNYMQAGNTAAGQEVMQMMVLIGQDPDATSAMHPSLEPETATSAPAPAPSRDDPLGEPREDLDRFIGLYGDPNETRENWKLWVAKLCTGHLVAGAMMGDASPWYMRTLGETSFESEVFGGQIFKFDFEIGPDGTASAMIHEVDFMPTPLPRLGPLPDDWEECIVPGFG